LPSTDDTVYGFNSNADRTAFHIDSADEDVAFAIFDAREILGWATLNMLSLTSDGAGPSYQDCLYEVWPELHFYSEHTTRLQPPFSCKHVWQDVPLAYAETHEAPGASIGHEMQAF
jgi:hypothetical protein